ncbi:hypothetical protein WUBG_12938 [Wuchereria bancrofti]|uniref:Uncharacterized protein n=1 Tax=Wuchereria bancrofti TaxID=6293 RepID=J9E1Y8_WUCBA|nr:hypothetical protein WUBG_12938 [Wuchereria bancrofti]
MFFSQSRHLPLPEGHILHLLLRHRETEGVIDQNYAFGIERHYNHQKYIAKKRLVNSNKMGLLTTKCDRTNESNLQNLQRISPQSLSRVACRPPHCGGLYHKYLKPLFWDPITSRNDRMSRKERKERFMKEVGTVDSTINVQNAQIETSLQQTELQLSLKNLQQKETSRLRLDRGYLQQQDQVNNAPAPSLSTTEIKTPRGWQRTFLHVSCKTSRLDRFAPQFVEAVSAQVWITEPLQRTAPLRQTLPPKPSNITFGNGFLLIHLRKLLVSNVFGDRK